ncbi:hypothetical protein MKX01_014023 [Papaver californicum]|nr:hypothetical protein MKX01_014023 [Papaver californicum]
MERRVSDIFRTIKVWETKKGKLISELKKHGHRVNSLALSTDYVLRTGAFDHTGKQYSSPEEIKEVALERYKKMKGNAPERLVSGSDDCTMFLWEPPNREPLKYMTDTNKMYLFWKLLNFQAFETALQVVNHVSFSPDGQWIASASFCKSVKLWNGTTGNLLQLSAVMLHVWSADSRLLLSGSKDSTLKVIV